MLSRLCAHCWIWTTITSLSGTSEIFVTLSQTLIGTKNLRFSLTGKCVKRYGSNLRTFILSVSVASLPIVQWKPPPLRVVEAIVLRSVDDLRFPSRFGAVPPRIVILSVFHKYFRTLLRKNPSSDDLLTVLQQIVPPSTIAGQRNVDIQRVMHITRPPKPKPKPKPKRGKAVAQPGAPHPPPPPDRVHPSPNVPQGIQNHQPNLAHSNRGIGCSIRMGGGGGGRYGQWER